MSSDLNAPTSNDTLNRLLKVVREKVGGDWEITETVEHSFIYYSTTFRLYKLFHGGVEINFYRTPHAERRNDTETAELVAAYLYGVIAGAKVELS